MNKNFFIAPLGIAGASIGLGEIGKAFDSQGLISAGETASNFISPAINLTMGGFLINQLRDLEIHDEKEEKKKMSLII